jgi:hypothetical protein
MASLEGRAAIKLLTGVKLICGYRWGSDRSDRGSPVVTLGRGTHPRLTVSSETVRGAWCLAAVGDGRHTVPMIVIGSS